MQVAIAAAIRAAEARHGHEPLSDSFRDAAFQILVGFGDECLQNAGVGQEIVDVPSSGCSNAFRYLDVAIHALEAAWTARRAGVRIVPSGKVHDAKGCDLYLPGLWQ